MAGAAWGALWAAAALLLAVAAGQQDPQLARVACDARYSAPCSRSNSEFLAWDTARNFSAQLAAGSSSADVLAQITAGAFNIDVGFYPFVFDAATSELLAHGERDTLVGKNLTQVFDELELQYSDAHLLHARFVAAASTPDGAWVLWSRREAREEGTCDVLSSFDASRDEETPYPFPAMLPYPFEDPRVRDPSESVMGGWGGDGA